MKKTLLALPIVALLVVSLAACTGSSNSVKVSGDFGKTLKIESGVPVSAPAGAVEFLQKGSKPATDGVFLVSHRSIFNGTTGESLTAQNNVLPLKLEDSDPQWLRTVVETTGPKERAIMVTTIIEMFGEGVAAQVGMKDSDPLIVVEDVLTVTQGKAEGKSQALPSGFPTVTLAEDGAPTVTLPPGEPSGKLEIADSIVGSGEKVKEGDNVVVQYQGTNWRTGEVFDQSWGSRFAISFNTEGVVKGFKAALVGHTVGSQVVAIIPPADGYGEQGNEQAGITGTDTLVFVVDILATLPGDE